MTIRGPGENRQRSEDLAVAGSGPFVDRNRIRQRIDRFRPSIAIDIVKIASTFVQFVGTSTDAVRFRWLRRSSPKEAAGNAWKCESLELTTFGGVMG